MMHENRHNDIVQLNEDVSNSDLYSKDLAPVPPEERTWSMWSLASLWVGMAVCIPTYMLASLMILGGLTWLESLLIIGLGNLIITIPMVLNGHAGVKYGIPFPVIGRSSFGIFGIHLPSIVRALVACGWFGIQTWIGGLAIYAIYNALTGSVGVEGLSTGKFIGFGIFWLINMYFIWKGTESIRFLEQYAAPILIFMGLALIGWGAMNAGGMANVLSKSQNLASPYLEKQTNGKGYQLNLNPAVDENGHIKADEFKFTINGNEGAWFPLKGAVIPVAEEYANNLAVQLRKKTANGFVLSKVATINPPNSNQPKFWKYILFLTAMVGFWATMSLSIADITRYAATQKAQIAGQFIGLPGTMMLFSFVGIFVTAAAFIIFDDILLGQDAPWDPVSLLAKFDNPMVVIISQIFMIIATLSTNIAANVIAPANAFSNLKPKAISFRTGGIITGIFGIIICPWWLMNKIIPLLLMVSGLLGPVLGVMLADYFLIRKTEVDLEELYKEHGIFRYNNGFNTAAIIALFVGVAVALIGYIVPALEVLYTLSWFIGFGVSFVLYYVLMPKGYPIKPDYND